MPSGLLLVSTTSYHIGDFLQRGNVCAEVLDPDPMLVVSQVTEQEINDLEIGTQASARLQSGEVVEGNISFISHAADEKTRTYRIEVEIPNSDLALRDGLSADVFLPQGTVQAHLLSPALLSLNDSGAIGVKVIEDINRVKYIDETIFFRIEYSHYQFVVRIKLKL